MVRENHTDWLGIFRDLACNNVLCWVNSTDRADPVIHVAQALADHGMGTCHVVMSLDSPTRVLGGPKHEGATSPLTPELIGAAKTKLARLYGDEVRTMVLLGNPVAELRRYAQNHSVDLIVMGAQGLAVERDYAERLVDNPPCPVMVLVVPKNTNKQTAALRHTTSQSSHKLER